jgi:hypothetical protein
MKKVVFASLLTVASLATSGLVFAQAAPAAPAAASGQVQMSPEEYKMYTEAIGQTTPQAKAPALEAYLQKYPQSKVKDDVLQQLMLAYSSFDPAKTLDAADRVLQVDPNNLRALTFEVYFRKAQADQATDPAAKQTDLDASASYAQKGLAATKPAAMSDADFTTLKSNADPIFYSDLGADALNKKDYPAAIDAFKKELAAVPVDQTTKPGPTLQDTYYLAQAYYQSTPPDLIDCTFYATRAASYAPDNFKAQLQPLATYCYKKYHGNTDGYDAVVTAAKASITPPANMGITPAPSAADIAAQTVASTPDLATLALSDKEFILQNGKPDDAEKVFATIKGKEVEVPDATVVTATDSVLKLAVSDDAVQSNTADFTVNMKEPLKTVPTAGSKITVNATYDSYTQNPVMIVMNDGTVPGAKKTAPARRTTTKKKPH